MHYQRWKHTGDPLKAREHKGRPPSLKTGERVGRLTVIEIAKLTDQGRFYRCACDCGGEIIVRGASLVRGNTRSCGCLRSEKTGERARVLNRTHGHTIGGKTTPTFNSWASMRDRCGRPAAPAYPNYGGRGITVCDRWATSFENFLADMGERPEGTTLDRIDPLGNYEPGNCCWSTPTEQARNRRKTDEIIALIAQYEGALMRIRGGVDDPQAVAAAALEPEGTPYG
jgi:hypothetical protein